MLCTARPAQLAEAAVMSLHQQAAFDLGCWVLCTGRWGWLILMPHGEDCLLSFGGDQGQGCPCPVVPKKMPVSRVRAPGQLWAQACPLSPTLA